MKIAALLLGAATLLPMSTPPSTPTPTPAPRRVLFVGNSLTTSNGLPAMVERMSAAAGDPMVATVVAFNDFSLADHWEQGDALRAIRRGGWDTVVLQQGPSSLPESRLALIADTRRFDVEIRTTGGRTALFMVWPPKSRMQFAGDVARSYADAAKAVGGLLLAAGDAWRAAWNADPGLALYGPDDFHPSVAGSTLAAQVIVSGITGKRESP
jgi:hypothetical protein